MHLAFTLRALVFGAGVGAAAQALNGLMGQEAAAAPAAPLGAVPDGTSDYPSENAPPVIISASSPSIVSRSSAGLASAPKDVPSSSLGTVIGIPASPPNTPIGTPAVPPNTPIGTPAIPPNTPSGTPAIPPGTPINTPAVVPNAPSSSVSSSLTTSAFKASNTPEPVEAPSNTPGSSPIPAPSPVSGKSITPHPDGNCAIPLQQGAVTSIPIDAPFPAFNLTHQPTFAGAASQGGGGWNVYWNIADPPQGCRTIVMKPYSQNRGTPGLPAGKEMINVGRGGCYFAQVPPETDILTSTCCGDACLKASLNSTSLLAAPSKRGIDRAARRTKAAPSLENRIPPPPAIRAANAAVKQSFAGSPATHAKRWWYPTPPQNQGCKFDTPNQPYSQAGEQVIVTSTQYCAQSPCMIGVSSTVSFSTTIMSSKSQTISNGMGFSTSITAGVNFLDETTMTSTFAYDFSIAISKATGQDVSHGNSTTITNTLSLSLGNEGAVTFTPVYRCYTGTFDCGKGVSDPVDVCQPDLAGTNSMLVGEYDAIVYNG